MIDRREMRIFLFFLVAFPPVEGPGSEGLRVGGGAVIPGFGQLF